MSKSAIILINSINTPLFFFFVAPPINFYLLQLEELEILKYLSGSKKKKKKSMWIFSFDNHWKLDEKIPIKMGQTQSRINFWEEEWKKYSLNSKYENQEKERKRKEGKEGSGNMNHMQKLLKNIIKLNTPDKYFKISNF